LDEEGLPKHFQVALSELSVEKDICKPEVLESILYQAAIAPGASEISQDCSKPWDTPEVQALLRQRREAGSSEQRKDISKSIQKVLRKLVRKHNDTKVENILKEFADLGRLDNVSKDSKPKKETETIIEPSEFVKLFEKVYESDEAELTADISKIREIPKFTMEDLQIVLKKMKNWKSSRYVTYYR